MKIAILIGLLFLPLSFSWAADLPAPGDKVDSTADIPAPPAGVKDTGGETATVTLPQIEESAVKPDTTIWKPKAKGFPFLETTLAAVGGGLAGGFLGFLNSGDANKPGVIDYNLMRTNLAIYGGAGFVAGGLVGFIFSHFDPVPVRPPEPLSSLQLAMSPLGPSLVLTARW